MTNLKAASAVALTALMWLSTSAKASDWGCQVLLCLADPRGPTTESECKPPIQKLWDALRKGKPFPTCDLVGGPGGGSFAQQGYSFFDQCPAGTTALAAGAAAVDSAASTAATFGIGEGDGLQPSFDQPLPPKVCVAGERGTLTMPGATTDDSPYQATLYDRIITIPARTSGAFIDVYVDGQHFNRVRY